MRGRGIGSYRLGDKYVSPDRKLSELLMQESARKGPAYHWSDTLGRIAQGLTGGYLAGRDRNNQDVANKAFTGVEPTTYRQPTEEEAYKESPALRNLQALGQEKEIQGFDLLHELPPQPQPSDFSSQMADDPNDSYSQEQFEKDFPQEEGPIEEPPRVGPRDYAQELAQGMRAYQGNEDNRITKQKMPQFEYSMQNLRGLENNPYAQRLLQGLMMNQMQTDAASRLAGTQRGYDVTDATTAYDRQKELKQMPMSPKQFEQKQLLTKPPRQQFQNTAEGVFRVNPDGRLGERVGSPHNQFGFSPQMGGANTQQGGLGQVGSPPNQSGVPIHREKPWEKLPPRNQGPMQQEIHKTSRAMLEKNRQDLAKMQTMGESLQRFQYLNKKQDKEAENELFGTKTGSMIDRMTDMSLDPDKQEMVRIQNLLTPQMRQGMPGAASDRDVAMFRGATVGINVEKEVNDNLVSGAMARLKNLKDRQSFMEEYFQKNQHLDGAETYWKEYLEANPIFDHSPELVGSYTLNKNRKSYGEFFDEESAINLVDPSRRSTDKKRSTDIPEGFTVSEWGRLSKQEQNEYFEDSE